MSTQVSQAPHALGLRPEDLLRMQRSMVTAPSNGARHTCTKSGPRPNYPDTRDARSEQHRRCTTRHPTYSTYYRDLGV